MLVHMTSRHPRPKDAPEADTTSRFAHKKSLGQNFLTSDVVPGWLVAAGDVTAADTVLEIGPGTGALTRSLLATGARVIALEADVRAIAILETSCSEAVASAQLQIHHLDVRQLDLPALGLADHAFKVVANIPYYLSGYLLRTLLEGPVQPQTLVFLMQKEVVERIARDPKESLLSLSVKVFGHPRYIKTVRRGHFNPPPKVDSAILQITEISRQHFHQTDEMAIFFNLLHLGFGQKRKQLLSNLSKVYDRTYLQTLFTKHALALDVRAETLSLEKWLLLFNDLRTYPQSFPHANP